jgi:hypothetical protein
MVTRKKTVVTETSDSIESTTAPAKKPTTRKPKSAAAKLAAAIGKDEDPKYRGMTPKQIATDKGEPWVSVLSVELDPDNIGAGAFELDWNEKFLVQLIRAGYQKEANEKDTVIVDRWFQEVCKNVVMENYEQWEANNADPEMRSINRKNLGGGRTEVS